MFLHVYRPTQGSQEFQECLIHICSLGLRRKKTKPYLSNKNNNSLFIKYDISCSKFKSKYESIRFPLVLKLIAYHVAQNFKGHFLSFLHIKQSVWYQLFYTGLHQAERDPSESLSLRYPASTVPPAYCSPATPTKAMMRHQHRSENKDVLLMIVKCCLNVHSCFNTRSRK